MARGKSLAAQLLQTYRDAQKAKATAARQAEAERNRQARAAERETAQRVKEEARRERERAQAWVRAQREKEAQRSAESRKAEQIVRDLEKREAARAKALEQKKRAEAREKAGAERQAKQQMSDLLRQEAAVRTTEIETQVDRLMSVLIARPGDLQAFRLEGQDAFGHSGSEGLTGHVEQTLGEIDYPEGLRGARRAAFAPEAKELVLEVELPGQAVVPAVTQYRYKASVPPTLAPQPRKGGRVQGVVPRPCRTAGPESYS
ncbi:hypothetical protein [Streptomyces fagopyri]|uniref:hypothetical protein n=1 Tax=Streptomyces fagopyri TaxID=2662397 RepID=UPI0038038D55